MAEANDNFDDLNALSDDLSEEFNMAANHLQKVAHKIDNADLLILYGYYKQATEGVCNVPKPSFFDLKGKSKWEAWKKLGDMSNEDAKMLYVKKVNSIDPEYSTTKQSNQKQGWVCMSMLQHDEEEVKDCEKTIVDRVIEGNLDEIEFMLKTMNKENINQLDDEGLGLIHWAADRGSVDSMRLLLSFGADINLEDCEKQTALHYASSCGHYDCVQFLLKEGADPLKKDVNDLSAIYVALDEKVKQLLTEFSGNHHSN